MNNLLRLLMFLIWVTSTVSIRAIDYASWTSGNTKGTTYTSNDGNIKTYARPDDYKLEDGSPRFNILINGEAYTGLYDSKNSWGGNVSFGYFDFRDGTPIEVVISCRKDFDDYDLLPCGAEISNVTKLTNNIIKFTISKANQNITLVLGRDYQTGDVLHLFCNGIDEAPPVANTEGYSYDKTTKTYYFGPGCYDLSTKFSDGKLQVAGGRKIYLAGGAVVYGTLGITGSGSKIYGHGMVVNNTGVGSELSCDWLDSGEIDGIICHRSYGVKGWQTTYTYCSGLTVKNMKVICTYGGSSDGMDLQGCDGIEFDNCFVRACDDAIAIKGLAQDNTDPSTCRPEKNLVFNRMQLWNDCNNAFGIGAETMASSFENIRFTNSDILYHYDDPSWHEKLDDRAAMNICCLEGTYFHNIVCDSIRVNRCVRLIQLGFQDSFWFGTLLGNQKWEGGIYDVHFRNITSPNNIGSESSNDILLRGWKQDGTPTKYIHDIWFDNVMIQDELFDNWENKHLKTNNTNDLKLIYDLHFNESTGIPTISNESRVLNDAYYNLQGYKIRNPQYGVFIHKGKKILLK